LRDWKAKTDLCLKIISTLLFFALIASQTASFIDASKENELKNQEQTLPVVRDDEGLFGNIYIETEDLLSLPQAKLLINDKEAGDFSEGFILVRVYENDFVMIDVKAYAGDISFHIRRISSNINRESISSDIISRDGEAVIGNIKFK